MRKNLSIREEQYRRQYSTMRRQKKKDAKSIVESDNEESNDPFTDQVGLMPRSHDDEYNIEDDNEGKKQPRTKHQVIHITDQKDQIHFNLPRTAERRLKK